MLETINDEEINQMHRKHSSYQLKMDGRKAVTPGLVFFT
jgi:hypothetical protein